MFRKGSINDPQMAYVFNAATILEAQQAKALLEKEGIPALLMDREDSGGYLRILGCGSPFGVDVYVSPENADRAKKLIEEIFSEENSVTEEELERIALETRSDEV